MRVEGFFRFTVKYRVQSWWICQAEYAKTRKTVINNVQKHADIQNDLLWS
jgi:hypothetical protein